MVSVKEIIIVEGEYDKIKLSNFIDGIIYVTGGFSIMQDSERTKGLATMVNEHGGVIFTDSDHAGFRIRNYLKQKLPAHKTKHAYIPDIYGKEKRKTKAGAEGLLGVEGMPEDVVINALKEAGCILDNNEVLKPIHSISKTDLFNLELTGRENSKELRIRLQKQLGLPEKLSSNMLCDLLSRKMDYKKLEELVKEIKKTSFN